LPTLGMAVVSPPCRLTNKTYEILFIKICKNTKNREA